MELKNRKNKREKKETTKKKETNIVKGDVKKVNHLAIIMDGNGRWAKKRHLPRTVGHREGGKRLEKIIDASIERGIKYLTVYAFSTENWQRPKAEVDTLVKIFKDFLRDQKSNVSKKGIKFLVSGDRTNLESELLERIEDLENYTQDNDTITLNIAFNYGGRREIIQGINRLLEEGKDSVSEADFKNYLYQDIPDPELIVRTSGEFRISNFLLWQLAYAEFYISDSLWPDFTEKELDKALASYGNRKRRFGGL